MAKLLWEPTEEQKKRANLTQFISFVNEKYALKIDSYDELYDWSIEKIPDFFISVSVLLRFLIAVFKASAVWLRFCAHISMLVLILL